MVRVLLPVLFVAATGVANVADAQDVPRDVLREMNLGSIAVLSDEQGMQVRGRGLGDLINLPDLVSLVGNILNGLPSIPSLPGLPSIPSFPGLPGTPGFPPSIP
jgi:hypothetical protein